VGGKRKDAGSEVKGMIDLLGYHCGEIWDGWVLCICLLVLLCFAGYCGGLAGNGMDGGDLA
jgi:hypothetical protein